MKVSKFNKMAIHKAIKDLIGFVLNFLKIIFRGVFATSSLV